MGRDLDGVVDHFTLPCDEAGWLRNKSGATGLGLAVQLKFCGGDLGGGSRVTWHLIRRSLTAPQPTSPLVQGPSRRRALSHARSGQRTERNPIHNLGSLAHPGCRAGSGTGWPALALAASTSRSMPSTRAVGCPGDRQGPDRSWSRPWSGREGPPTTLTLTFLGWSAGHRVKLAPLGAPSRVPGAGPGSSAAARPAHQAPGSYGPLAPRHRPGVRTRPGRTAGVVRLPGRGRLEGGVGRLPLAVAESVRARGAEILTRTPSRSCAARPPARQATSNPHPPTNHTPELKGAQAGSKGRQPLGWDG